MGPRTVPFQQTANVSHNRKKGGLVADERGTLLRELHALPGKDVLNRILETGRPGELIRRLAFEDFFWLVKKVGEDDCLPLLELASEEQWQYLLDLELWKRDRLDVSQTSLWMSRLQQADCRRLVRWLFSEGETLAHYHFFKTIEVLVIKDEDEVYDLPEGFFTLDGVFHIRVIDPQYRPTFEEIIRVMADEDLNKYQALLLGLAGVLPAEVEEEMYRLRNVRLAEHGFLPYEEAIAVYSPLDIRVLKDEKKGSLLDVDVGEESWVAPPLLPLQQTGTQNLFMEVVSGLRDPIFLDRLRLEFAGLSNQLMSADGLTVRGLEDLVETCKKAARLVNLAIERACGRDLASAEDLLRHHSLVTLFRVGFGMVLKLKWEAERWLKGSWFYGQGLDTGFWGEYWGGILSGLLQKRPRFYVGTREGEEFRDFEWISDLSECMEVLRRLMVLDSLLQRLTQVYQLEDMEDYEEITYHPLLFNLWSRLLLEIQPSFSGISIEQAKSLFSRLRAGSMKPPYDMSAFEERFVKDLMAYAVHAEPEAASILRDTLSLIWQEFSEEYEQVSIHDLDGRYSKFITIRIPPD